MRESTFSYFAAQAELVSNPRGNQWRISNCPLCGGEHLHGGGSHSEDPRAYLSHRIAHCGRKPSPEMIAAAAVLNCDLESYSLVDSDARGTDAALNIIPDEDLEVA